MERKLEIIDALDRMPSPGDLARVCRRAVADYPGVDPQRVARFLEFAQDPAWCTELVARHFARRMAEGLIP
jgi:hypothetical protein